VKRLDTTQFNIVSLCQTYRKSDLQIMWVVWIYWSGNQPQEDVPWYLDV